MAYSSFKLHCSPSQTADSSQGFILTPSSFSSADEELLNGTSHEKSKSSTPQSRPKRVKRPHTKSRGGCFSCKSRRIKCQETKPACANCIHKDLDCIYPSKDGQLAQEQRGQMLLRTTESSSQGPLLSRPLSTTSFTGDDLRFFHHFLLVARPHLPFGSEEAWLSDVPQFAHDCPHLMHAILSLGATHYSLMMPNGSRYGPTAIAHRGKALKALGAILAKGNDCTTAEMDGALATCYALTFQSHHMHDGMVDFIVMVRGCGLVTNWFLDNQRQSNMFYVNTQHDAIRLVSSWLPTDPCEIKDKETVEACIVALDRLQPLLHTPAHQSFYHALRNSYEALLISFQEAFVRLTMLYKVWCYMENTEFLTFIAPGNHVSWALFMHYITINTFLRPMFAEMGRRRNIPLIGGHFLIYRWTDVVFNKLPVSMQELVSDLVDMVALHLAPQLELHQRAFPEWNHELVPFAQWLRSKTPSLCEEL